MTIRDKVYVLPDDRGACGHFRLAWPAQYLTEAGHDNVTVKFMDDPAVDGFGADVDPVAEIVRDAWVPDDCATIVMQRMTHRRWVQAVPFWQAAGVRFVLDIDDDLAKIHAGNDAWDYYQTHQHRSVDVLAQAAKLADVVTVTTPGLARQYRQDAVIIPNVLPDFYYGHEREDSNALLWPAVMGTHPGDAQVVAPVIRRIKRESSAPVWMCGKAPVQVQAFEAMFGVTPQRTFGYVPLEEWPTLLAMIGVAHVPLADTLFNAAKSRLKVLELSACGVPWVASPRADYVRFSREGGGIGRFAERPNEWYRELRHMVSDPVWRMEQSMANREAAEFCRMRDHLDLWRGAWGLPY